LIVGPQVEDVAVGEGELVAHQQREDPAKDEEQHRGADIEEPDIEVVDLGDEAHAFGRLPGRHEAVELVGRPGERVGELAANQVLAR
jgi:hypothetical protein